MSGTHSFGSRPAAVARDEVLEELWTAREGGIPLTVARLAETIHAGPGEGWSEVVEELVERGLVRLADGALELTETGEPEARQIVRRHRLAEVLFNQVLELPMEITEAEAMKSVDDIKAVASSARESLVSRTAASGTSAVVIVVLFTELIKGIAQASEEQAQGVDQVNTAVSQMDKVTQQNAAGAEGCASASEELAAQAQAVKGMVNELIAMVGGSDARGESGRPAASTSVRVSSKKHEIKVAHSQRQSRPAASTAVADRAPAAKRKPGSNPDPTVPKEFLELDDDAVKEF